MIFKLPFFRKKKLLLAFEYGVIMCETARERGIEVTKEMVARAEEMIENEFVNNDVTHCAMQMLPNVLSVFETDSSPDAGQDKEEDQAMV